jgi:hypothetical protein
LKNYIKVIDIIKEGQPSYKNERNIYKENLEIYIEMYRRIDRIFKKFGNDKVLFKGYVKGSLNVKNSENKCI